MALINKLDKIVLPFESEMVDYIVDNSIELRLGARGMRSIVEAIMIYSMFDYPSSEQKELTITLEYARDKMNKVNLKRLRAA